MKKITAVTAAIVAVLIHTGAASRDYQASTGRYIQPDPSGQNGGLNRYVYVDGDPLRYIDPYGLEKLILLPKTDINYPAAAAAPDVRGLLTIYAHGNPNRVSGMDAERLATDLKNGSLWKAGMPIKLDACRTGEGDANIARDLARKLNTTVTAPDARTLTSGETDLGVWHSLNIPGTERTIPYWPGKWITFPASGTRQ